MNRAVYDSQLRQAETASLKELELLLCRHAEAFSIAADGSAVDVPDLNGLLHRLYARYTVAGKCDLAPGQLELAVGLIARVAAAAAGDGSRQQLQQRFTYTREMSGALMDALIDFYFRSSSAVHEPHRAALVAAIGARAGDLMGLLRSAACLTDPEPVVGRATQELANQVGTAPATPARRLQCLAFLTRLASNSGGCQRQLSDDRLHACLCALVDILRWPARAWLAGELGGGGSGPIVEVDGQTVGQQGGQQFLTCAHQFAQWSSDLELSHAAFSVLRRWLLCLLDRDAAAVARTGQAVKADLHSLCWQLLDQCERRPACPADVELMQALLIESVELASLLCRLDSGLLARYFTRMEALYGQLLGPAAPPAQSPVLHVTLAKFLLTHHASVGKDALQFLTPLYTVCVDRLVCSQEFCLELVQFTSDNIESLCWDHGVTMRHFPSLIKLLARWPSTFASEFADSILPACLSPTGCLEMLHCLIDLPCLAALYELNRLEPLGPDFLAQLPANVQPYALYLTRDTSGSGDTVAKIEILFDYLTGRRSGPLVVAASAASVRLVGEFADLTIRLAPDDCLGRMLPALAERSLLLYGGGRRHSDALVARLASFARRIIDRRPRAVVEQLDECLDFVAGQWKRAVIGAMPVYLTLVWGFGEASRRRCRGDGDAADGETDAEGEAQRMARLYESLELLVYEILAAKLAWSALPPKFWCCLATSLAKVACSVQDNLHRCLLALTKVRAFAEACPPGLGGGSSYAEIQCLLTRLSELLALLRQPTVGPHVLQPDWALALEEFRAHENPQSVARVTQLIGRLGLA